jgi:hypothetical protein
MSSILTVITSTLTSSKIAASAAAVGVLTVGGVGTAAYTGSLPTGAQSVAHQVIGAPAPAVDAAKGAAASGEKTAKDAAAQGAAKATDAATKAASEIQNAGAAAPAVPGTTTDGTGAADLNLVGLCQANANGSLDASSTGFASLSVAAKGSANISAFCQSLESQSGSVPGAVNQAAGSAKQALPSTPNLPSAPAVPAQGTLPTVPAVPAQSAVPSELGSALHQ